MMMKYTETTLNSEDICHPPSIRLNIPEAHFYILVIFQECCLSPSFILFVLRLRHDQLTF